MWNQDPIHRFVMDKCENEAIRPRKDHPAKLIDLEHRRIHAVKQCQHCFTIFGRDVNAARNIFRIFMDLLQRSAKHLFFCKSPVEMPDVPG